MLHQPWITSSRTSEIDSVVSSSAFLPYQKYKFCHSYLFSCQTSRSYPLSWSIPRLSCSILKSTRFSGCHFPASPIFVFLETSQLNFIKMPGSTFRSVIDFMWYGNGKKIDFLRILLLTNRIPHTI